MYPEANHASTDCSISSLLMKAACSAVPGPMKAVRWPPSEGGMSLGSRTALSRDQLIALWGGEGVRLHLASCGLQSFCRVGLSLSPRGAIMTPPQRSRTSAEDCFAGTGQEPYRGVSKFACNLKVQWRRRMKEAPVLQAMLLSK